jgi:hypothetical protein
LAKQLLSKSLYPKFEYFNWDTIEDRPVMDEKSWDRKKPLVIFDEIHKKPKFKSWLKGIYDKEGVRPRILVTGSSRLDIAKKMGGLSRRKIFWLQIVSVGSMGNYFQRKPGKNLQSTSFSVEVFLSLILPKKMSTTNVGPPRI